MGQQQMPMHMAPAMPQQVFQMAGPGGPIPIHVMPMMTGGYQQMPEISYGPARKPCNSRSGGSDFPVQFMGKPYAPAQQNQYR